MPAELAWLFATRPVFLYPELLPCASLDPALYCPRRTAAFTAAEDWYIHKHKHVDHMCVGAVDIDHIRWCLQPPGSWSQEHGGVS